MSDAATDDTAWTTSALSHPLLTNNLPCLCNHLSTQQNVDVKLSRPATSSSLVHAVGISSSGLDLQTRQRGWLGNLFGGSNDVDAFSGEASSYAYWNLVDFKQDKYAFVNGGVLILLYAQHMQSRIHCVCTAWACL